MPAARGGVARQGAPRSLLPLRAQPLLRPPRGLQRLDVRRPWAERVWEAWDCGDLWIGASLVQWVQCVQWMARWGLQAYQLNPLKALNPQFRGKALSLKSPQVVGIPGL